MKIINSFVSKIDLIQLKKFTVWSFDSVFSDRGFMVRNDVQQTWLERFHHFIDCS
jgi:hypothetical protein